MSEPISPPPVRDFKPEFIPAYVSNGLIGLRLGRVPLTEGLVIVNGLAARHPIDEVEGFSRAPYPVAGDIAINKLRMREHPERVRFIEQRYDFSCGELVSRFAFEINGIRADAELLVFCSRTQPTLVLHELRVSTNADCELSLTVAVDPSDVPGRWLKRETTTPGTSKPIDDGSLLWECHGGLSKCGAAYVTRFEGGEDVKRTRDEHDEVAPISTTYTVRAHAGSTHVVRTFVSLVADQMHSEPHREASRLVAVGAKLGFDYLREQNRAVWRDLWRSRVCLVGAGQRWQALSDAAFYYLHSSAHPSSVFSTSMFGLAYWPNYHYYRGQVMWDIESFVFLPLVVADPHAAEALLEYRGDRLNAARRNAAMNGYRGLQFPWASGPRHGEEMIRTSAPLISLEQHIGLSIALAFANYTHITGDMDFLREHAWAVLEGVANWIESRVERTERGYEIKKTIGIAEQRESPVDNVSYVNMAATGVLYEAAAAARRLERPGHRRWEAIARDMFVPRRGDVVLNHDKFTPEEDGVTGATPETLAALFPVGYCLDAKAERATIDFYLGRVEPYLGHPMLSPLLGVYAAWIGDRARSADLFEKGYAEFINEPFTETDEFSRPRNPDKPRVGPFQANIGGFLSSCLFGLTGLRVGANEPSEWARRPVVLPEGWSAIEVENLWIRGRQASLHAAHGAERAELIVEGD